MPFSTPFWSPSQASAVLFDWDGVIAETRLDFSGIREKYYGGRRAMLLEDAVTLDDAQRKCLMRDLEELEMQGAYDSVLVPGISDVLRWVDGSGIPWAVVSRNCRRSIIVAAEQIGIDLPDIVRSRDDGDCIKPDPRALFQTCSALGVPAKHTLFIGDFIYDMMGARRAGMRGVLVRKSIETGWDQWLECAYDCMAQLCSELTAPTEITCWEYKDVEARLGRDFLFRNSALSLIVPTDAKPDMASWALSACALGVGRLVSPTGRLEPDLWRKNQAFDISFMGMELLHVLHEFLRARYPFVAVDHISTNNFLAAPREAELIEEFLLQL